MQPPQPPLNETLRLAALARYEVLDTPPEASLDALTRFVARALDVPIALVSLVDVDRQWFKSRFGLDASQTTRAISFCGHVLETDRELVVEDTSKDPRFADNPLVNDDPHIGFYAGFPLRTPDGFVLGTLCAIDRRPRQLDARGRELLELLSRHVVDLLELRRAAHQRKSAEALLQNTLGDLRKSHDDLLHVLNAIDVGVLLVGGDRELAFANDALLSLLNVGHEAVLGRSWEELLGLDEPSRQAVRAMKATPEAERTRLSLRLARKGQRPHRVELDLRDDPRDAARQIFFLYDVSDVHDLREKLAQQRLDPMIGESPVMHALFEQIAQVARGDWTVLVEGETGSGKELVARAIHAASPRKDAAFIAVNCAGLTDSLLASQLFGHVRGAFTGASSDQQGLFEAAAGGTLFLDEIGDISMAVQASLLRVLQEKEITRVGETRPRKVNVRIVLATHRDLRQRVQAGLFREDLLYRIRNARVRVPPLRERRDDVPLLANAFLAQQRVLSGKLATEIGPLVMERLVAYDWPGNVRELRAAIEHSLVRCRGKQLEFADLPSEILEALPAHTLTPVPMAPAQDERVRILDALRRSAGNRVRAARLLGIGRATLYRRLEALGIEG